VQFLDDFRTFFSFLTDNNRPDFFSQQEKSKIGTVVYKMGTNLKNGGRFYFSQAGLMNQTRL